MRTPLTIERLKFLLSYDPATGLWTWVNKTSASSHMNPGDRAGCAAPEGYVRIRIDGYYYKAHRLAIFYMTGKWPPEHVDHRNRVPGADAFTNLRPATRGQNNTNRRTIAKSNLKGVYRCLRHGHVRFEVYLSNPRVFVGTFKSPVQAAWEYDQRAEAHYGEFAVLNFKRSA